MGSKPGNCQNRLESSFNGINDFNEYWTYSEYPYLADNLGSDSYLAYPPPSDYWTLSIESNTCSMINYNGIFSWNDLTQCQDYSGNDLIDVTDNGQSITLSGTLYVNLVSPYSMGSDTGIYRTFPLIEQDFEISILKQINVLSSTGIELFITSIIGIYEDETDGSFKLSVLTQSADYIELTNPNVISTPFGGSATISSVTSSCLVALKSIRRQKFNKLRVKSKRSKRKRSRKRPIRRSRKSLRRNRRKLVSSKQRGRRQRGRRQRVSKQDRLRNNKRRRESLRKRKVSSARRPRANRRKRRFQR